MTGLDLSVILVGWNSRKLLEECLPTVLLEAKALTLQVILVDNASTDDTVAWCHQEHPEVEIIALRENRGFSGGNNTGIAAARGRHILLLNTDTVVRPGALETLVHHLDEHPEVGAVGPRLLNADGSLQPSCRGFPTLWTEFCQEFYLSALFSRSQIFSGYYLAGWDHGRTQAVAVVTGAALMIRREVLASVGHLDEKMSFMFYEEIDWCWRLARAGWPLVYVREAEIMHLGGGSGREVGSGELDPQREAYRLEARFNYHRKHGGWITLPVLWLIHGVSGLLGSFLLSLAMILRWRSDRARVLRQHYLLTLKYLQRRFTGQTAP